MNDQSPTPAAPPVESAHDAVPATAEGKATHTRAPRRGHLYQATVTAHFPNEASITQAQAALEHLNLDEGSYSIQWLKKTKLPGEWGDRQPGLAEGVTALIAQVADPARGAEIVTLCEEAGAEQVNFYAEQRMTW